jgi:UDP-glucose 4-epimerase
VKTLVTGSAGHLGEALARVLGAEGHTIVGLDLLASPYTDVAGSITDRALVRACTEGVEAVLHTATLHKPHLGTHTVQDFIETNVIGTQVMLEEAASAGVGRFVLTSTTSVFGRALSPPRNAPAAWITEKLTPVPKNVYGVTKRAAEDLAELVAAEHGLPIVVLRTSRFFPESDDRPEIQSRYCDDNLKVNELLYRRVDLEDVVSAHKAALERARMIRFGRYIVSATTPFCQADVRELSTEAPAVVKRLFPHYDEIFDARGWMMFPSIDRVYVNDRARHDLDWHPRFDFGHALTRLAGGKDPRSQLSIAIGAKGYHATPVDPYTQR